VKVLHIYKDLYPPTCGGIEVAIQRIIEGTRDACEEISVLICSRNRKTEFCEVEGTPVYKAGEWGRVLSAPLSPYFPYWLKKLKADILHYHIPNPTAVMADWLVRPQGKIVVHYHSDIVRQKNWLFLYDPFRNAFLRKADSIIVTSPNYLKSSQPLQPFKYKCKIVPFGVPLSRFARTPEVEDSANKIRRRYGEGLVLFVGIQRYYKGLFSLVEAMENVPGKLLLVGNGPLMPELIEFTQKRSYADRIIFVGQVESVVPYYYASDVFCLPSIYRSEAFGLVLAEAGACGLPLVTTELGTGTSYVNQHNETGLVVPPNAPRELSAALRTILTEPGKKRQFGQAAKDRTHTLFSHTMMCDNILSIYHEVMQRNSTQFN
jgi:glycosyltransferase involved in cell wall biosynthesis